MASTKEQILEEISGHINKQGGPASAWYVGITGDLEQRLHGFHQVPKENHWFMTRQAESAETAREIERSFVEQIGTDGGTGGGDDESTWVYAYLITDKTKERENDGK